MAARPGNVHFQCAELDRRFCVVAVIFRDNFTGDISYYCKTNLTKTAPERFSDLVAVAGIYGPARCCFGGCLIYISNMRIKGLGVKGAENGLQISAADDGDANWITVLTGANGTKKSVVLRLIASAALGFPIVRIGTMHFRSLQVELSKGAGVSAVIAISGTPFDRFNKMNMIRRNRGLESPPGELPYSYFGFRSVNGSAGAIGISRIIASLLWKRQKKLATRQKSLCPIFEFLGFVPMVAARIRRPPNLNVSARDKSEAGLKRGDFDSSQLIPFLEGLRNDLASENNEETLEYAKYLLRSKARLRKLERFLEQFPALIVYDLKWGSVTAQFDEQEQFDIEKLIDIGLLVMDDLLILPSSRPERDHTGLISATSLSSGQWQLLLGLLGLGLEVEDNAVILIDEPENSLHPEWQRNYVRLLETVLSERKRCHIVVATHSPLIASGVDGQRGNIVRLVPSADSSIGIATEPLVENFGWDVNETLEALFGMKSTRSSSFVAMVDTVLGLIRDGKTDSKEFISLGGEIVKISKNLPKNDPMLPISLAIRNLLPGKLAHDDN